MKALGIIFAAFILQVAILPLLGIAEGKTNGC